MPTVEPGASKMSTQQRNLDTAGLRRMQDLDKTFFGGAAGRNRAPTMMLSVDDNNSVLSTSYSAQRAVPWTPNGTGQLPPLINAWAENGGAGFAPADLLQPGASLANASKSVSHSQPLVPMGSQRLYGTTERPRTVGSAGGPGQRRAANAKPTRRGGPRISGLEPLSSSSSFLPASGANPWEALQEAAPATRYGGNTARDSGGLKLLMPTGSSRASMLSFENRLLSYLQPVSGPSGTAALVTSGGAGVRASSPRPPTSGASPCPPTSPGRPPTSPPRPPGSPPRPPGSPPRLPAGGAASINNYSAVTAQSAIDVSSQSAASMNAQALATAASSQGPHGPSLPPLVPRSNLHAALGVPAPGAEQPWGGAGLPHSMYSALAELRGGIIAGLGATPRDMFQHGGMNAVTAAAAAATAAGIIDVTDDLALPPSLGQMISVRPSNRRQVQLMADWLDSTIGLLWEQHLIGAKANGGAESKGVTAGAAAAAAPGGGGSIVPGSMTPTQASTVSVSDASMRAQGAAGNAAGGGG
ncbi:hypothetical protein Vretifemale_6675, partial [Volvox reticuliferus]